MGTAAYFFALGFFTFGGALQKLENVEGLNGGAEKSVETTQEKPVDHGVAEYGVVSGGDDSIFPEPVT